MKQASFAGFWRWLPVCLFFSLRVAAQAPASQVPVAIQPRWIDLLENEWKRGKNGRQMNFEYTIGLDAAPHNAGFFGQRLRRDMRTLGTLPPESEQALNRYRRQKWIFLTERAAFLSLLTLAGADLVTPESEFFPHSPYILSGAAVVSLLANVFVTRHTNEYLQRAVKEYQGAVFPQGPRSTLDRLRPDFGTVAPMRGGGVGLVVGWQL